MKIVVVPGRVYYQRAGEIIETMGVEETSPSAVDANTDGLHEEPRATQGSRRDSGKGAEFSSEPEKLERPTGFKLYLILASMTFTQFVIMLDISVIVTVRDDKFIFGCSNSNLLVSITGHPSDNRSFPLPS